MLRTILSIAMILGASSLVYAGGTGAFFSDTENSIGNTFAAGAIDLKIDNQSYYNGTSSPETSWSLDNLSVGTTTIHKFFNFLDLKPADYGEDTISLHVNTNDAYLCASVKLTSNNENGCTEPEALVDNSCDDPGAGQGELAQNINFLWWADDGDNVLETGETVLPGGNLGQLGVGNPISFALADSQTNIWNPNEAGGPITGNTTHYIGKAWCLGTISADPLPQDNATSTRNPSMDNNNDNKAGTPEDGGIHCDGIQLGNDTQTDSLTADVSFSAVQSRHNESFVCSGAQACEANPSLNLVADGSFETPTVANNSWNIFASPVGGWNVLWRSDVPATFNSRSRPDPAFLELQKHLIGTASDGVQYAELDTDWSGPSDTAFANEPSSVLIYQDIPTVPGATYTIKYDFAPRPNTPSAQNELGVYWGGAQVNHLGPATGGGTPIAWQSHSVSVVATSTTTRLGFEDLGTADSTGTLLDNVQLYQEDCGPGETPASPAQP